MCDGVNLCFVWYIICLMYISALSINFLSVVYQVWFSFLDVKVYVQHQINIMYFFFPSFILVMLWLFVGIWSIHTYYMVVSGSELSCTYILYVMDHVCVL